MGIGVRSRYLLTRPELAQGVPARSPLPGCESSVGAGQRLGHVLMKVRDAGLLAAYLEGKTEVTSDSFP